MPSSQPPIVAIDLGAESCRVSLLTWPEGQPAIRLVHRFANAPVGSGAAVRWDIDRILSELVHGLRQCAEQVSMPIASIGVDGWAVDYVRLGPDGKPLAPPHCYRDPRTEAALDEVHQALPAEQLYALTGAQPLRINTLYQLVADRHAGLPAHAPWLNLPEYVLARLGGRAVAEYTNAAHTGLMDVRTLQWSEQVFARCGLDCAAAPELVPTGTDLGQVRGPLAALPALCQTRLMAPACHDTASAIAGIPLEADDLAYISSGTWSLVGTLLDAPVTTAEACAAGFTNLQAAGHRICFHKNVNGMWLLKQTLDHLSPEPHSWTMTELVAAAAQVPPPQYHIDVDDPAFLLPGEMAARINAHCNSRGLPTLEEHRSSLPAFASLIFSSLARQYAKVLQNVTALTGKALNRLCIVGGGSLNAHLNRLTAEATGLEVLPGAAESSTIGNFAVQLAALEGQPNAPARIAHWARTLTSWQHD